MQSARATACAGEGQGRVGRGGRSRCDAIVAIRAPRRERAMGVRKNESHCLRMRHGIERKRGRFPPLCREQYFLRPCLFLGNSADFHSRERDENATGQGENCIGILAARQNGDTEARRFGMNNRA